MSVVSFCLSVLSTPAFLHRLHTREEGNKKKVFHSRTQSISKPLPIMVSSPRPSAPIVYPPVRLHPPPGSPRTSRVTLVVWLLPSGHRGHAEGQRLALPMGDTGVFLQSGDSENVMGRLCTSFPLVMNSLMKNISTVDQFNMSFHCLAATD